MFNGRFGSLVVFAVLMILVLPASGQELVGSRLFGTVTDPSGRAVPGATVVITAPATGFTRTVQKIGRAHV